MGIFGKLASPAIEFIKDMATSNAAKKMVGGATLGMGADVVGKGAGEATFRTGEALGLDPGVNAALSTVIEKAPVAAALLYGARNRPDVRTPVVDKSGKPVIAGKEVTQEPSLSFAGESVPNQNPNYMRLSADGGQQRLSPVNEFNNPFANETRRGIEIGDVQATRLKKGPAYTAYGIGAEQLATLPFQGGSPAKPVAPVVKKEEAPVKLPFDASGKSAAEAVKQEPVPGLTEQGLDIYKFAKSLNDADYRKLIDQNPNLRYHGLSYIENAENGRIGRVVEPPESRRGQGVIPLKDLNSYQLAAIAPVINAYASRMETSRYHDILRGDKEADRKLRETIVKGTIDEKKAREFDKMLLASSPKTQTVDESGNVKTVVTDEHRGLMNLLAEGGESAIAQSPFAYKLPQLKSEVNKIYGDYAKRYRELQKKNPKLPPLESIGLRDILDQYHADREKARQLNATKK